MELLENKENKETSKRYSNKEMERYDQQGNEGNIRTRKMSNKCKILYTNI